MLPKLPLNKTKSNIKGIQFTLFYECNLHCKFCFQERLSVNPITEKIKSQVNNNIKKIKNYISTCEYPIIEYKLLGGEIFLPTIEWDWLKQVIFDLINISKEYNKQCQFVFMTNLIHSKQTREKVKEYIINPLKEQNIKFVIAPSFDIYGRFNTSEQLKIFKDNCEYYRNLNVLGQCNIVLSAPTCRLFTNKQIPTSLEKETLALFNNMYQEGFKFDVDYYAARNIEDDPLMPTETELLDTLLYLWYNYQNIRLLQTFKLSNTPKKLNCCSELQVEGDVCTESCIKFYHQENNPNLETKDGPNYKERLIQNYMNKKQCLLCKWYKYCPMGCFFYLDNKMKKEYKDNECLYKKLFNQINKQL